MPEVTANTPKSAFTIDGYNFFHVDRTAKSRGGVGCYISSQFPAKQIKLPVDHCQPEMIFCGVTIGSVKVAVGTIYKSPKIPYTVFAEIHENIAFISSKYKHVNILGDFNVDQLKIESAPQKFLNSYFREPFALSQIVDEPTRIQKTVSHTTSTLIDLVFVGNHENVKTYGVVDTPGKKIED